LINAINSVSEIKTSVFDIDFSQITASSGSTHTVGTLPSGAVLNKSYYYIETKPTSASDNTVAFKCMTSADLAAAKDLTEAQYASGQMVNGALNWANTATGTRIVAATGCNVTMTIGSGASGVTAGLLKLFVEYFNL
jgi:hypothetical protein